MTELHELTKQIIKLITTCYYYGYTEHLEDNTTLQEIDKRLKALDEIVAINYSINNSDTAHKRTINILNSL